MESNNNTSKIALIVLAVLTAVFGVLYFRSNQLTKEQATSIEEKATELANTRVKLDSISTQLDNKIAEIKALGGQVADLEALKLQLEQDKSSLKKANHATVASYLAKIKEYDLILAQKDGDIVELKKQIDPHREIGGMQQGAFFGLAKLRKGLELMIPSSGSHHHRYTCFDAKANVMRCHLGCTYFNGHIDPCQITCMQGIIGCDFEYHLMCGFQQKGVNGFT
jgi:hypothetical protein